MYAQEKRTLLKSIQDPDLRERVRLDFPKEQDFRTSAFNARTSMLDMYALTCLQNKPKILHESISFRYHLYLLTL